MRRIQWIITITSLALAIVHLRFPDVTIDAVSITLFVIAIVPWLAPLFKSIEFPGGWKIDFQDLVKAKKDAKEAGLLSPDKGKGGGVEFAFQGVSSDDPNLALAGLRIEIEKCLNAIAESHDILVTNASVGRLISILDQNQILEQRESSALRDIIGILNSAVHGAEVDQKTFEWAIEIGPDLLFTLNDKIAH